MFQKIKSYCLLFFCFLILPTAILAEPIPFQLSYTKVEYQYGNTLIHFVSELSQNKFSKKDLVELLAEQSKAPAFIEFKTVLERASLIGSITDQDSFFTNCVSVIKNNKTNSESLEERLNMNLDRYCRSIFLSRLTQLSPSINFSTRDLNYIKDSAYYYITGESQQELINFFKNFKNNLVESKKISEILHDKYIEFKIRPPSALLVEMHISPKFKLFLQDNINLDDKSSKVFQDEYVRNTREAVVAIQKGDFARATQLTRNNLAFYNNNKNFISDERAWLGITQIAKELYFKGRDEDAREFFTAARTMASPEKEQESIYNLIWPTIVTKDDKALMVAVNKHNLEKTFSKYDSKLQYWIAYAFYKSGDQKKAFELFNKIVSTSPYSYYSILALKMLALNEKGKLSEQAVMAKLINKAPIKDFQLSQLSNVLKHSLSRLAIWQKLDNDKFVKNEVRFIRSLRRDDVFNTIELAEQVDDVQCRDFLTLNLVRLLNSKNQFISSFKIFQDSLDQNSLALNFKLIKYIFPMSYYELIKRNAQHIDPLVIISLIRQESGFNPNASSVVGATGLMQLMPATARRFNSRVRTKHLTNPEINVTIGIKYLKQLIVRYDGNLIFALAAYNAGEGKIDKWRREIFKCEDPLATIEAIPYEETRNYVKLIYRNYFFYSLLAEKSILMKPIQDSFQVSIKR